MSIASAAEAIEALARRHSAFHRARHIKSAADLLRLILAYAPGGRSLRKLAAEAAASGVVDVSDVALLTRFRRCGDWLIALCENLLARRDESAGGRGANWVRLIHGSRIEGPGKTCFRLHLCYDVAGQRIADFAITRSIKAKRWIAWASNRATSPSPIAVIRSLTACALPATPAPICSFD